MRGRHAVRDEKDGGHRPQGSPSSADLEEACDDFQEKWGHGIKLIADATGGIAEKVALSGRLSQGLEDQVAGLVQAVKVVEKSMDFGGR